MPSSTSQPAPVTQNFIDLTGSDDETGEINGSPTNVLQSWGARTHRNDEQPSAATLTGWQPRQHPDPRQRASLPGASSSSSAASARGPAQARPAAPNPPTKPDPGHNPKAIARTSANGITIVSEDEWRSWPGGPVGTGPKLDFSAWKNYVPSGKTAQSYPYPTNPIAGRTQPSASISGTSASDRAISRSGTTIDRPRDPRLSGAYAAASNRTSQYRQPVPEKLPSDHGKPAAGPNHPGDNSSAVPRLELLRRAVEAGSFSRSKFDNMLVDAIYGDPPPRPSVKRTKDGTFKQSEAQGPTTSKPKANEAFSTYLPSNWDPHLPKDIQELLQAMRRYTHNGKPNRNRVMKWAEENIPDKRFFIGYGDLSTKSPLHSYTLTQLGLTEEAWTFLCRKRYPITLPGPDNAERIERATARDAERSPTLAKENREGNAVASLPLPSRGTITSVTPDHKPTARNSGTFEIRPPPAPVAFPQASTSLVPASAQEPPTNSIAVAEPADARTIELKRNLAATVAGRDMFGQEWLPEEDDLLIHLKEEIGLRWQEIWAFFKYRCKAWSGCQAHYSGKLSKRHRNQQTDGYQKLQTRPSLPTRSIRRSSSPPTTELETFMIDLEGPRKSSRLVGAQPRNYRPRDYFKTIFSKVADEHSEEEGAVLSDGTIVQPRHILRRNVAGAPPSGNGSCMAQAAVPVSRTLGEHDRNQAALAAGLTKIPRQPVETGTSLGRAGSTRLTNQSKLQKRRSVDIDRPYLAAAERDWVEKVDFWLEEELPLWQGSLLHVDFSEAEVEILEGHILEASDYELQTGEYAHLPAVERVAISLVASCEEVRPGAAALQAQIKRVLGQVVNDGRILNRAEGSIKAFLEDATAALVARKTIDIQKDHRTLPTPKIHRLEVVTPQTSVHQSLRRRELGPTRCRRSRTADVREAVYDSMGPLLAFTGTSSDVNAVAWSPDGDLFGVGSAAWVDSHSMQYNRPNNLLMGSVGEKSLKELPFHAVKRQRADQGSNATHAMHTSQDPLLYQSVSAVGFTSDGSAMISAGYDGCARVFDLRKGFDKMYLKYAFKHNSDIDVLALNNHGLFATGNKSPTKSIRVFRNDLDTDDSQSLKLATLFSPRARDNPGQRITPSSLKWGHSIYSQSKYLLCGFSSLSKDFGEGEVCLWDIEAQSPLISARGSRNIFDVAWSPCTFGRYAVGRTPQPSEVNRGTQSVVHLFDSRLQDNTMHTNGMRTVELECPALDMNDIVFNPTDDFLLSVGCTDGATYIWDIRRPDELMHRFAHGKPLIELPDNQKQEESDTGVRFVSWDASGRGLITGSSDGVVAKWSPYRATEDAFDKSVAQLKSGIMSGAFNHDFSNLLLGEVNGSINVLSVGRNDEDDTFEDFTLQRADDDTMAGVYELLHMERPTIEDESGTTAARKLLHSGGIQLRPFGDLPIRQAVQGPAYQGPLDQAPDADQLRVEAAMTQASFEPSAEPCQLKHDIPRITEEEKGDDGTSVYRIPESFLHLSLQQKKAHINKYIRCFRCGHDPTLSGNDDIMECEECRLRWRVDLLGYTPLNFDDNQERGLMGRESRVTDGAQANFGIFEHERNQLHALDECVHSFWQDRPASPL